MTRQQALIPMAAGECLQQQRKARKLSLAAIARDINLDETLLRKIEEGKAGHIAPVYRNGYIRSYANYLQIPPAEIQKLIDQTAPEEAALRTVFLSPPKSNPVENWSRAGSYVLASLLIGTLVWQFSHEAMRLSQNGSRQHDGPEEVQFSEPTSPQGLSLIGPEPAGKARVAVSDAVLPEGESRLQVSVTADSWVEISDADGRELEMDLLRGGSIKSYQGKMPFRILIGRASAVNLSMNGEAVDMTPFISDDVAQMTWPQHRQAR